MECALKTAADDFSQREIGAQMSARALDRVKLAVEIAVDDDVALSDRNSPHLSATKRARGADRIPALEDDSRIGEAVHGVTSPIGDSSPRRNRAMNAARNLVEDGASTERGSRERSSLRSR